MPSDSSPDSLIVKVIQSVDKGCSKCRVVKPSEDFYVKKSAKSGLSSQCRECSRQYARQWANDNPDRVRAAKRRFDAAHAEEKRDYRASKRYGITAVTARLMYERPCEICGKESNRINIDHCHSTGRVRGSLCSPCNTAIHILDNPELLAAATAYLANDVDHRND